MNCERCGTKAVTRVVTQVVDGQKRAVYLCDACADREDPGTGRSSRLDRPCDVCGEREGRIKLTRLRDGYRTVTYVCELCARRR